MRLPVINITKESLSNFDEALQKEWLVTNGLGGYASSTVLGINTRKYHGLLVAALHPPGDRTVCLAKLDEEVQMCNSVYSLGTNEFRDAFFPQGYHFLNELVVAPFPRYIYSIPDITVEKTVFMSKGKNVVAVIYKVLNRGGSEAKIRVYPLLTCRHFHSTVDRGNNPLDFNQEQKRGKVEVTFNAPKVTVTVSSTTGEFNEKAAWIEHLYYREEAKRGESSTDDCYQPGYFEVRVPHKREKDFALVAAASENNQECNAILDAFGNTMYHVNEQLNLELEQHDALLDKFYSSHREVSTNCWLNWILLTADTFIVKGASDRKSVLAGYFWFETWGRDSFISLPGLMLATGRFEDAQKVLLDFMCHCRQGLIPNRLDDRYGEPAYNTVDATLWYVNAILQFLKYTGNFRFVQQQLWEELKTIVEIHKKGAAFGIRVDSDGLLVHGPRLTWMDAEVDGVAITPRAGKAVEIQALWYNMLRTMQLLADRFEEKSLSDNYGEMAAKAQTSFNNKFWNHEGRYLFDVVVGTSADASLRPNQVIAASLDFTMLDKNRSTQVIDAVQRELLTPCGLRTLARSDSRYKGRYIDDRRSRDKAYHNGTVWAWLLGPYVTACRKARHNNAYELKNRLMPLFTQQINQAGLGTVNEVFDGDPPHIPRGCIAQAWSVAEPLRAYIEDVLEIRPKYEKEFCEAMRAGFF
jgi:predicted glycogen debranching enzyme